MPKELQKLFWERQGIQCVSKTCYSTLKVLHMIATGDKGMLPSMKSKVGI